MSDFISYCNIFTKIRVFNKTVKYFDRKIHLIIIIPPFKKKVMSELLSRLSGNLVGISINLCKSIQKELFINDTS